MSVQRSFFLVKFILLTGVLLPTSVSTARCQEGRTLKTLTTLVADFQTAPKLGARADRLARLAKEKVAAGLARSGRFVLVSAAETEGAAKAAGLEPGQDLATLQKVERRLQGDAIVTGEIIAVKCDQGGCRVELSVRVLDSFLGTPINGADAVGKVDTRPLQGQEARFLEQALDLAVEQAVQQIVAFHLQEGRVRGGHWSSHILFSRGSQHGIKKGMLLDVLRDRKRVALLRVTETLPTESEVVAIKNIEGIRETDYVRVVLVFRNHDRTADRQTRTGLKRENNGIWDL